MPRNATDKFDFGELLELQELPDDSEKTCPGCGASFTAKRYDQVYCKWQCSKENWNRVNKTNRLEKTREIARNHYNRNKEKCRNSNKNWRTNNKEKAKKSGKNSRLKKQFGITLEQYEYLKIKQDNKCAICRTNKFNKKGLVIDHCHRTGRIRELLCSPCNVALGWLKEDPQVLLNMINYLKKWST